MTCRTVVRLTFVKKLSGVGSGVLLGLVLDHCRLARTNLITGPSPPTTACPILTILRLETSIRLEGRVYTEVWRKSKPVRDSSRVYKDAVYEFGQTRSVSV
jgi:hypothetical protein